MTRPSATPHAPRSTIDPSHTTLRAWPACVLLVLMLAGCSLATQPRVEQNLLTPAPTPINVAAQSAPAAAPSAASGAATYASKCLPCHGESGAGDGPQSGTIKQQGGLVANLIDPQLARAAKPADWFVTVRDGRLDKLMPGFAGSLSAQQRWDALAYVWALGTTTQTLSAGQTLYTQQCQACHGAQGKGDGPQAAGKTMASFADPKALAQRSLNDLAHSMTTGDAHKGVKLDEAQRYQVADYARSLGYMHADPGALQKTAFSGDAALRVQVENMTPNSPQAAALAITLRAYDTTGEVFSRTAQLDSLGNATFGNLPLADSYFYQAETLYSGAKFFATPEQFTSTNVLTTVLPIYEVTTDPGVIAISEMHYFVQEVSEGTITVVELYLFDNSSDRAYVDKPGPGGQLRSLKISLPPDASNLRFDGPGLGARFTLDGNTLYDSDSMPPGQRASSITMLYDIPYRGGKKIERQVFYPLQNWDVLMPDGALRATDLVDKGLQQVQSGSIRLYSPDPARSSVPAGGMATFQLSGQPVGEAAPSNDGRSVGFGFIALAVAIGLSYFLISRSPHVRVSAETLDSERDSLLRQLAELDTRHAEEKIKESTYRKQREQLKERLRDLW